MWRLCWYYDRFLSVLRIDVKIGVCGEGFKVNSIFLWEGEECLYVSKK